MKGIAWILIALAALVAVLFWQGCVNEWGQSLFGPPSVELSESYAGDEAETTFTHEEWDAVLKQHADVQGLVDYAALAADSKPLDDYIARVAEAPFEQLSRDGKLALLINAYNAFTLRLILDHDIPDSIMDIPSKERWSARRWKIGGRAVSLDEIEHEYLRERFVEPRIHFAISCASMGCPPLRPEAYVADRIDMQLEEHTRATHQNPRWFELRGDTLRLTKIYQWYAGDFMQAAGSVLAYAAQFDQGLAERLAKGDEPEIEWIEYDWSLNARR